MTPVDESVLAELERLNQAATRAPWKPDPMGYRSYVWGGDGHMVADDITDGQEREGQLARLRGTGAEVSGQRPSGENDANYDLIIAMRNALPGMLQELRTLRMTATEAAGRSVPLTLEEAIAHAEERSTGDSVCAREHAQLAAWLKLVERDPKQGAESVRCNHDGAFCHHKCPNGGECFRAATGSSLSKPWEGYPVPEAPGHDPV